MKLIHYCNKIIEYSFYFLFFFVPLLFSQYTSELFELNKMWATYAITVIIVSAWVTKMLAEKQFRVQRTLLDIPILLFLVSQILSTIFSLDQRISFFGYYSRFNGGLLSTISYILLYYAFVSNLNLKEVWRSLTVTLLGGTLVALWGFPSHFGSDPTCLMFRGTFDTSCWTDAFHPTVRIFSTLGQPAWLAAYLALLLPLAVAYMLRFDGKKSGKNIFWYWTYFAIVLLFYADLLFANTRAGFLAFLFAYILFWMILWLTKLSKKDMGQKILIVTAYAIANIGLLYATLRSNSLLAVLSTFGFLLLLLAIKRLYFKTFVLVNVSLLLLSIMFSTPIGNLQSGIQNLLPSQNAAPAPVQQTKPQAGTVLDTNITDSGNIRKIVWTGAFNIWKAYPILGSGVETYAFAYYKFRPLAHNQTSEWDYLYNKAHNEFLNYLATTGIVGLASYLAIIGVVLYLLIRLLLRSLSQKDDNTEVNEHDHQTLPAVAALFAGYISILITNFFGFSVVIINVYFFLIPAFLLLLMQKINEESYYKIGTEQKTQKPLNGMQWTGIMILGVLFAVFLLNILRTWNADKAYALGYNLNRYGDFQNAYLKLSEAVQLRPAEPVFKNEFAVTNATIASVLFEQKDTVNSQQFANQAIALSNEVTMKYPNNILFWKDRFKIFYLMNAGNPPLKAQYQQEAITSMQKVIELAPTDAKAHYNLGILYRDNNQPELATQTFEKTVALKNDYRDAHYALGLAYRQRAINENNTVINPEMQQKAEEQMQYILSTFNEKDAEVMKSLQEWQVLAASAEARITPRR